jgi:predicted PurR-regulated permease PerM
MPDRSIIPFNLTQREHRWLTALLILGTIAVGFIVLYQVTSMVTYFQDVIMIFFLAWLLAFVLSPIANGLRELVPGLPRALAVILSYALLIVLLLAAAVVVAQQLSGSLSTLLQHLPDKPTLEKDLAGYQQTLNSVGLGQVHLADQVWNALESLKGGASALVDPNGPLAQAAIASLGIMGNLLFVFFLSLYMAVDRDRIVSFLFRLVPPNYKDEAKLLEHSVARSFGGFLRGQALMGLMYGCIALVASLLLGLPYVPVVAVSSGILQAIPFFGPFISWLPPVLVAIFFAPAATIPVLVVMIAGWFVLMNIIQPRLMAEAVGLHPVVVLGSVMVGTKLAGIPGAIFGIPVAAVVASFFFYYLGHMRVDAQPVAVRAARRVEQREGRSIRVPRLPVAGRDQEVEPTPVAPSPPVVPLPDSESGLDLPKPSPVEREASRNPSR